MDKLKAIIGLCALAAIGIGVWHIYPPAAPVVVGGLIWYDLSRTPS